MNLSDIVNGPWAITPAMHQTVQEIYARHLRGEAADLAKIAADLGRPLANERKPYQVVDGVAVLPMIGVMAKRANMFIRISGGVSTEIFANELKQALSDPNVAAIVINGDTPGGTVDGTPELAAKIFAAREIKPVITWSDGVLASAGIWVGSAASKVYISSDVVTVGSIGVVATHTDFSAADAAEGRKVTEITAGKYKRIASSHAPLSESGRAAIQEQVDDIYSVFVDQVAAQRGMTVDDVLARAADGRVFLGKKAIAAGLVDGIMTFEEVLSEARRMAAGGIKINPRQGRAKGAKMDAKELAVAHPEAVGQIRVETEKMVLAGLTAEAVSNSCPAVAAALREAGAKAERERIASVRAQAMPGHEALIAQMEMDGKSTGADAAMAIIGAEKEMLKGARDKQASKGNPPVAFAPPPAEDGKKTMKRADFDKLAPGQKTAYLAEGGEVRD